MKSETRAGLTGHVLIHDKQTGEILCDRHNSIHFENTSEALANAFADRVEGHLYQMAFGNGGTTVSGTGAITYFPPNVTGAGAALYNQTFIKVIDDNSVNDVDPDNNFMVVVHSAGHTYADIVVTCTLGFNEPAGQEAFDTSTSTEGNFIFDELALYSFVPSVQGKLLTHVIFHPVQKSINRIVEVRYTLRLALAS